PRSRFRACRNVRLWTSFTSTVVTFRSPLPYLGHHCTAERTKSIERSERSAGPRRAVSSSSSSSSPPPAVPSKIPEKRKVWPFETCNKLTFPHTRGHFLLNNPLDIITHHHFLLLVDTFSACKTGRSAYCIGVGRLHSGIKTTPQIN
ncbi:unnamed protein product, partial [Ectocarpus sp. 8 AP-2014]